MYNFCINEKGMVHRLSRKSYFDLPELDDELIVSCNFEELSVDAFFHERKVIGPGLVTTKLHPALACDGVYLVWLEAEKIWIGFEYSEADVTTVYRLSEYASRIILARYALTQDLQFVYCTAPYAG